MVGDSRGEIGSSNTQTAAGTSTSYSRFPSALRRQLNLDGNDMVVTAGTACGEKAISRLKKQKSEKQMKGRNDLTLAHPTRDDDMIIKLT